MFLFLFFATGVGNASTFQMIPTIMRKEMDRLMPTADAATRARQAEKESAAIIGFTSAIAAFGAFFIPKSLRHLDRADRRRRRRRCGVSSSSTHLHRHHLVVLHPPRRPALRTSSAAATRRPRACRSTG